MERKHHGWSEMNVATKNYLIKCCLPTANLAIENDLHWIDFSLLTLLDVLVSPVAPGAP